MMKTTGLAAGAALLASTPASAQAPAFERREISGPPEHNPTSEYVFTISAGITEAIAVGETVTGRVQAIPITGGSVQGENFSGEVIPGGADWQLIRKDGVLEVEATYAIRLQGERENVVVKVLNQGIIVRSENADDNYSRTRITFTAPEGEFTWMNKAIFLSRVSLHPELESAVKVDVFRLI